MSYADEVKERLSRIFLVLLDLLNSKKFWVAMGGAVTTYQTTGDARAFLWAALAYVGAQALADFGKEGAAINVASVVGIQPTPAPKAPATVPLERPVRSLFNGMVAQMLEQAGYATLEQVKKAELEDLKKAGFSQVQIDRIWQDLGQDLADHP